ncbi:zinc finger protein RFP-like [Alligator sinensis]|uniref:Zinc finger protein RFP-like n=1 Tax=Alligator sinensis TaxID=38654 RepID=A0A1U7SIB0_ALLSI|nr:zinc finger protein RFP-like [Alligator sinensis]
MAAGDLAGKFQEEVTCSVCLDYFMDPVTLGCGHNFCRGCISQCCGELEPNVSCPQCRETALQRNLRPNRQLGNVVELVKQLRLQAGREPEGQRVYERHQELFCQENEAPISLVCDRSRVHRDHTVVPVEEAVQDCKKRIRSNLESLKEEREMLQGLKCAWEQESERLLRQTALERQLLMFQCKGVRQVLEKHERILLARLRDLDTEIVRRREENVARLCKETACLSTLIMELEGKCQQQDISSSVSRGEIMSLHPALKFPELAKRIRDFRGENKLQEALTRSLERLDAESGFRRVQAHAVDVTLDPGTAHPNLILSEDRKRVRVGDRRQHLLDNPERFDTSISVLGSEGFTGGRHYWEVEVGDKTSWDVGVCRESVRRKGKVTLTPGKGYWALCLRDGGYKACISPLIPLPVRVCPRRVGVFLDYEAGEVSFYNVTDRSHLFTFIHTFSRTLRPFFSPCVNARGTNAAPLILCSVPAQT